MSAFVHPALLWALPLVGLPVLIHLINLLRHRRVAWAAMEFLLASQKRNRNWIVLKQMLLLLARMAIVAVIVGMAAQPLLRDTLAQWFGGATTHHIVLLDDSYSMSDRAQQRTAFDEAKRAITRIAEQVGRQESRQVLTLLRFSRVARGPAPAKPDLYQALVDDQFPAQLEATLATLAPAESALGPEPAVRAVAGIVAAQGQENRVIYLVSDFRAKDWDQPTGLRDALSGVTAAGARLQLIHCVDAEHANLAITSLVPGAGIVAANVPLQLDVTVHNFGTRAANNVTVLLSEDDTVRPGLAIESIPAGKSAVRRFTSFFATAGQHRVRAQIENDITVAADNMRYAVLDVPASAPALLIDGDPRPRDARLLAAALAPGGKVSTGVAPLVESPGYLRDHALDRFATLYLLNIDRLDETELRAVEEFARSGRGVALFLGERCRAEYLNAALYRDGQGLLPTPLTQPVQLLVDRLDKTPDLQVTDHPVFRVFAGERNSFLQTVNVDWYFGVPPAWQPPPDRSVRVIARLRNQAPLAVEQRFGQGRVVAFLTKLGPGETPQGSWNNWGRENPSFVVAMLELQAYLMASGAPQADRLVGAPLELRFPAGRFQPQVRFALPHDKSTSSVPVNSEAAGADRLAQFTDVDVSGVYQAQLTGTDGKEELRQFAVNVDPAEGDLRRLDAAALAEDLRGVPFEYFDAGSLEARPRQSGGAQLATTLCYCLALLLVGEQALAAALSYHLPQTAKEKP